MMPDAIDRRGMRRGRRRVVVRGLAPRSRRPRPGPARVRPHPPRADHDLAAADPGGRRRTGHGPGRLATHPPPTTAGTPAPPTPGHHRRRRQDPTRRPPPRRPTCPTPSGPLRGQVSVSRCASWCMGWRCRVAYRSRARVMGTSHQTSTARGGRSGQARLDERQIPRGNHQDPMITVLGMLAARLQIISIVAAPRTRDGPSEPGRRQPP